MICRTAEVRGYAAARTFALAWCMTLAEIGLFLTIRPRHGLGYPQPHYRFDPQTAHLASIAPVLILCTAIFQFRARSPNNSDHKCPEDRLSLKFERS
jgi:hypothetical protein